MFVCVYVRVYVCMDSPKIQVSKTHELLEPEAMQFGIQVK